MVAVLANVVAASMMLYEARTSTFGCGSASEVAELQRLRADEKSFQKALYEQIFYGECVALEKGKVVEGSTDATNPSLLLVDRSIIPPGYLAPLADFDLKPMNKPFDEGNSPDEAK
jgi:hypothetical protein